MSLGPNEEEIAELLRRWAEGDEHALDELIPLVYDDLHRMARYLFRGERPGHTLQPTALINEAWIKLRSNQNKKLENHSHFLAIAARAMRQILVDHARKHKAKGRDATLVPIDSKLGIATKGFIELVILNDALDRLAKLTPAKARVWELRYFGDLNNEEIGEVLGISSNTVIRYWNFAQDWLGRELEHRKEK